MRKIALVIALIAMASMAFALDIAVSGNATLTAGYNLNSGDFGLSSGTGTDIDLVIAEGSKSYTPTQEWYGDISVTGAKFWLGDKDDNSDGDMDDWYTPSASESLFGEQGSAYSVDEDDSLHITIPSVSAKITNGTYYVVIAGNPDFNFGLMDPIEGDDDKLFSDGDLDNADGVKGSFTVGGTVIEGLVVEAMFGVASDWTDDNPNAVNNDDYSYAVKATYSALEAANVTLYAAQNRRNMNEVVAQNTGATATDPFPINVGDEVITVGGLKVNGKIDIVTYYAGADFAILDDVEASGNLSNTETIPTFDAKAGVVVTLGGLTVSGDVSYASILKHDGVTVFARPMGLDAAGKVAYVQGDLSASVAVKAVDLMFNDTTLNVAIFPGYLYNVSASYKINDMVKVAGNCDLDVNRVDFGTAGVMAVRADVSAALSLIENVTFTLKWEAEDLTDVRDDAGAATNGDADNNIGYITFETKIAL